MKHMRTIIPAFFVLIALASCEPADRHNASSIVFVSKPVQTESLLASPTLKFIPGGQQLNLSLGLKNLVPETLHIMLVMIHNANGMTTFAEGLSDKMVNVAAGKDTTLMLTFNPINDKVLFQAIGLHGLIDSAYSMSLYYTIEGKEGTRVANLTSRMSRDAFLAYRKLHERPIEIYHFNTTNGFDEKQRQYLNANTSTSTPPFVHTTEQEVAVSGLNFRIKCYHRNDSLHAELFAVNHSDMTIRIDTSKMDLMVDGLPGKISNTHLTCEKVTGSKDETDILRKGDRVIIRMRKYVREHPDNLSLACSDSFFLSSGKPLFSNDLELIRTSLK
jgi:hypothetical protein